MIVFLKPLIVVNDNSYESLIRDGRCGTRYGMTSKVSVQKEIDK